MPKDQELVKGTTLFANYVDELLEENPEVGDFHGAFEQYCINKYSLGSGASNTRAGGKNDLGIDFFSVRDSTFNIGQCKIPARDWLEAHPAGIRRFGPQAVNDAGDALRYLLGQSDKKPNDKVRYLRGLIETEHNKDDFEVNFFVLVYGKLNKRALENFMELKERYRLKRVHLFLQQFNDILDEFIVGRDQSVGAINIELKCSEAGILRAKDYCYFLANAAGLFEAFQTYGWRLFDLNLRYEIRNSPINADIVDSLGHAKSRRNFHQFNNGLIIVCKNYTIREKAKKAYQIRVAEPQIVNGLQTVKSIYNAVTLKKVSVAEMQKDCWIQVKTIKASDMGFVANVVRSTNNQNPMSPRNLKANGREQKLLRKGFAALSPRWFLQVKEGEWESLMQEGGRFFKQIASHPPNEFKPDASRKKGRVIDNQDIAKAWLALIGFADIAGDRVTHYFSNADVYELCFALRPTQEHWQRFSQSVDFDVGRKDSLESQQADPKQYLLASFLWQFARYFVPSAQHYRSEGLQEGVLAGKIQKASGTITSPPSVQEEFLAENVTYQTWRLMANMKELLVESAAFLLTRKYGSLGPEICWALLSEFDGKTYLEQMDIKAVARKAANAKDFEAQEVFSRIFALLKYASTQFWEEKRKFIYSTSRIRTVLLRRDIATEFKKQVLETSERKMLSKPWKPENQSFLEALPTLGTSHD